MRRWCAEEGGDEKLFFSRGTNHDDKSLNKGLCDFELGDDGIYHAWIDKDDNFHAGKPSGGVSEKEETRNFRIYWDRSNNNLYQIYLKRNDNGQIISSYGNYTGYDDSQTQKWWYYDFSITAKPSEFAKMSVYADFQGDGKKYQPLKNSGSINISEFEYNSSTSKYEYGKKDNALALSGLKQI